VRPRPAHAGTTQFRSQKNPNSEAAERVPAFVRWPGHFMAGKTLNGLVTMKIGWSLSGKTNEIAAQGVLVRQ